MIKENDESILAVYDEFSLFYDSLDKGTAGKSRENKHIWRILSKIPIECTQRKVCKIQW